MSIGAPQNVTNLVDWPSNCYSVSIEVLEIFTLVLCLGAKSSFELFRRLTLSTKLAAANATVRTAIL
jgi:hypothetical protein